MESLWKDKKIALFGATGVVGRELLKLLLEKNISPSQLFLFASKEKTLFLEGSSFTVSPISALPKVDLAFLCAGSEVSEKLWNAFPSSTYLVDLSSRHRMDPGTPLVIPEINPEELKEETKKVSSPNCIVSLLLLPLFPLHQKYLLQKVILSTYQAASGAGASLVEKLLSQTKEFLQGKPNPYAFNVYPHESRIEESGYAEEEIKITKETRKILKLPDLSISATAIRVPVIRSHSLSVHVEFQKEVKLSEVKKLLQNRKGLIFFEDKEKNHFATPFLANYKKEVFCGRIRNPSPSSLEMWIVGDQLLKGAAFNALQIAEELLTKEAYVLEEKNG